MSTHHLPAYVRLDERSHVVDKRSWSRRWVACLALVGVGAMVWSGSLSELSASRRSMHSEVAYLASTLQAGIRHSGAQQLPRTARPAFGLGGQLTGSQHWRAQTAAWLPSRWQLPILRAEQADKEPAAAAKPEVINAEVLEPASASQAPGSSEVQDIPVIEAQDVKPSSSSSAFDDATEKEVMERLKQMGPPGEGEMDFSDVFNDNINAFKEEELVERGLKDPPPAPESPAGKKNYEYVELDEPAGPMAVLLIGHNEEEAKKFRQLMTSFLFEYNLRLVTARPSMKEGTLLEALQNKESDFEELPDQPKIIVWSGMDGTEIREAVKNYKNKELNGVLPQCVMVGASPANLDLKFTDFVDELGQVPPL
eukprot:gnl/TRDRNA2_/TRDRNA2_81476_c0_seq1.p1 gnl/TRDRNA2_/TRDRNA2_81476_c0~~gnl/TRDRNA2_/TRDRNA2_81476_c0_seq1.p1  ORF type:complete len:384 (+),score=78.17 gnl/TRDRNA2_/TRDRNA2_81476_c0_seq1:53-1153(+)